MAENEKIIPLKKEDPQSKSSEESSSALELPSSREDSEEFYARRIIPTSATTVGRSIKLRDVFTISGAIEVNSTVATVSTDSHTTTETTLGSFTFFKNEFHPDMLIRLTALGTYTSDGTRTVTLKVGSGAAPVTEWNSIASTAASTTNQPWSLTWYGVIKTIGPSGTLEAQLIGSINNVSKNDANSATVAIDTTGNLILNLTATWSASNASNSITIRQYILEIIN